MFVTRGGRFFDILDLNPKLASPKGQLRPSLPQETAHHKPVISTEPP